MIEYNEGDILLSDCQVVCNPVNCEGVMGKGLAAQFKKMYPLMFEDYKYVCSSSLLKPGMIHVWPLPGVGRNPRLIFNVATKARWTSRSEIGTIVKAVGWINEMIIRHSVDSIAIPALGCGEGGLKWLDVRPILERMMWQHKAVRIVLYPPKEKVQAAKAGRRR